MKRLYISLGLILLMAALSGLHVWRLDRFIGELRDLLTQAQEQAEQEAWESAAALTRQARDKWMDQEDYLHVTLRHADTDAIQIAMDEALAFLEGGKTQSAGYAAAQPAPGKDAASSRGGERQPAEYAAANARLLTLLDLLAEAENPTLTNLL